MLPFLVAACAQGVKNFDRPLVHSRLEEQTGLELTGAPGDDRVPQGVETQDGISEEEAVATALWNNAAFAEAIAGLGLRRADLVQAGLLSNPVLSVLFPIGPKQLEFTARLPLEFLLLRTKRIAISELEAKRAAAHLVAHGLDLVRDVRLGWIELAHLRRRLADAEALAALRREIAQLYETDLRAGAVSELETSRARVDAHRAAQDVVRFRRRISLHRSRLRSLLGLSGGNERLIAELPEPRQVGEDVERCISLAEAARPELRAAEIGLEAACERAGLARWRIVKISGLLDANEDGRRGFEIGPGAEIELPIFDWGQGASAAADAGVERAARHLDTVRESVRLEVRETHGRVLQFDDELSVLREQVIPALEKSIQQLESAHRIGSISRLPILQTRLRLFQARAELAAVRSDYAKARIELERSVGGRLE